MTHIPWAMIFFGMFVPKDIHKKIFGRKNWKDVYAAKNGLKRPTVPRGYDCDSAQGRAYEALLDAYNAALKELIKFEYLATGTRNSKEFFLVSRKIYNYGGGTLPIMPSSIDAKEEEFTALEEASQTLGIPFREPRWYLGSGYFLDV